MAPEDVTHSEREVRDKLVVRIGVVRPSPGQEHWRKREPEPLALLHRLQMVPLNDVEKLPRDAVRHLALQQLLELCDASARLCQYDPDKVTVPEDDEQERLAQTVQKLVVDGHEHGIVELNERQRFAAHVVQDGEASHERRPARLAVARKRVRGLC